MRHLYSIKSGEKRRTRRRIERGQKPSNSGLRKHFISGRVRPGMQRVFCCARCGRRQRAWWYFLEHPEVPPDNNRAERSLRLAVTKRKVCGGSRSMEGFSETADLLSVIQTCRAQGRSVIEFFKQALQSIVSPAMPKPSLIPQT